MANALGGISVVMTLTIPTHVMVSPGVHIPARLLLSSISTALSRVLMVLPSGRSSLQEHTYAAGAARRTGIESCQACHLLYGIARLNPAAY